MNFMERLEEGLNESSEDITKHMRVSTYRKTLSKGEDGEVPNESFLVDDSDMAHSTVVGDDEFNPSINGGAAE